MELSQTSRGEKEDTMKERNLIVFYRDLQSFVRQQLASSLISVTFECRKESIYLVPFYTRSALCCAGRPCFHLFKT